MRRNAVGQTIDFRNQSSFSLAHNSTFNKRGGTHKNRAHRHHGQLQQILLHLSRLPRVLYAYKYIRQP